MLDTAVLYMVFLWGLLIQFPPFCYFPHFPALLKQTLATEYHVYIWQVSLQLSSEDTVFWTVPPNKQKLDSRIQNRGSHVCRNLNKQKILPLYVWDIYCTITLNSYALHVDIRRDSLGQTIIDIITWYSRPYVIATHFQSVNDCCVEPIASLRNKSLNYVVRKQNKWYHTKLNPTYWLTRHLHMSLWKRRCHEIKT